jgi:serine protease Do
VVIADGTLVLTNQHVVRGASRIRVEVPGSGGYLRALPAGGDDRSDIALLRLISRGNSRDRALISRLKAVRWGKSTSLSVGDPVAAIGNPFGFSHTVSSGVVSALERVGPVGILESGQVEPVPLIQTDASIHPGSSGGPLLNLRGEMVGLTTLLFSRDGSSSSGIAFALPADELRTRVDQILSKGRVSRAWLGISAQDLDSAMDAWWGGVGYGVVVTEVAAAGPAGGILRAGDLLLDWDGLSIRGVFELRSRVQNDFPGREGRFGLLRGGKYQVMRVRLGLPPDEQALEERTHPRQLGGQAMRPGTPVRQPQEGWLAGMRLEEVPPAWLGGRDPSQPKGAWVTRILPDSPALDAGILPGDWILEINRSPLEGPSSTREFAPQVDPIEAPHGEYLIALRRGGPRGEKIYRVIQLD